MLKRDAVKRIVKDILQVNYPIQTTKSFTASSVHQKFILTFDDKVSKSTIIKFVFSLTDRNEEYVFPYLPMHHQKLWSSYPSLLFSILHEIGHTKTFDGLNYDKIKRDLAMVSTLANIADQYTLNVEYRKIEKESVADEWAYQWAIANPTKMAYYAEMLESSK